MGDLLRLPLRPRRLPPQPDAELILLDRTLGEVEEKRRWLAARRLRVAGAELALLKGGKS